MEGKRGSECLLKPVSNIDFNPSDVKEDVRNNNLDKFTNLFNKAVQEAVEKKVTGNQSPQNGGQQFNASMTREDFAQMSLEEQTNLYRQNPDLYNKLK